MTCMDKLTDSGSFRKHVFIICDCTLIFLCCHSRLIRDVHRDTGCLLCLHLSLHTSAKLMLAILRVLLTIAAHICSTSFTGDVRVDDCTTGPVFLISETNTSWHASPHYPHLDPKKIETFCFRSSVGFSCGKTAWPCNAAQVCVDNSRKVDPGVIG